MNQVAARAMPGTESPKTHTASTFFLAVDDTFELKIAHAWLKHTYPNTLGKVVKQLPLHRLPHNTVVIPITRGEDRTAAMVNVYEGHSVRTSHVDVDKLMHEVREATPIDITKHWRTVRDEFDAFGGDLNRDSFLEALSNAASPAAARMHIGTPNVVRLSFV
jgi:hypothetical protein